MIKAFNKAYYSKTNVVLWGEKSWAPYAAEIVASGEKCTSENILFVVRKTDGHLVWLETGNKKAGLQHIITRHASQFSEKGIPESDIPAFLAEAVANGEVIGLENSSLVYKFIYMRKEYRVAIAISDNGYIVTAFPKSIK